MQATEPVYAVLNPLGDRPGIESTPLTERISGLNGKVIYCVGQIVMGSEVFIAKAAVALAVLVPGTTVVEKRKPATYMTDDPELWDEIAEKADAVIYGCGA